MEVKDAYRSSRSVASNGVVRGARVRTILRRPMDRRLVMTPDGPLAITYTGNVSGATVTGTVDHGGFAEVPYSGVRIERARFKRRVLMTLAVAFVAADLVAVNAQAIEAWITTDIWRVCILALGAVAAMFYLSGIP